MLFFTFINGVIKMKKFMVSQYSDKNKTINTFCTDYYQKQMDWKVL